MEEARALITRSWDFSERRRCQRFPLEIEGLLHVGSALRVMRLVDLSLSGAQVLVKGSLTRGRTLLVSVEREYSRLSFVPRPVAARVVWTRREGPVTRAGLEFIDSDKEFSGTWAFQELKALGSGPWQGERRRYVRVECCLDCRVGVVPSREIDSALVQDLSMGGARLQLKTLRPERHTEVVLCVGPYQDLPRLKARTRVIRRDRGQISVEFLEFHPGSRESLAGYVDALLQSRTDEIPSYQLGRPVDRDE